MSSRPRLARPSTLLTPALAAVALLLLSGCDPTGDFVLGKWDFNGNQVVLDASSGPSGEHPVGTAKIEDTLIGIVGCVRVTGSEALVGLDMSPSIGLTALARISGNGEPGSDTIRLSPSGLSAADVCDADLEPGPPQAGTFLVHDKPAP